MDGNSSIVDGDGVVDGGVDVVVVSVAAAAAAAAAVISVAVSAAVVRIIIIIVIIHRFHDGCVRDAYANLRTLLWTLANHPRMIFYIRDWMCILEKDVYISVILHSRAR